MYKGRIWVWSFVLVVALFITNFTGIRTWYDNRKASENLKVYVDSSNPSFSDSFDNIKFKRYHQIYVKKEDADMIVQRSSDEVIDGYEKYANKFYTPMVVSYSRNYEPKFLIEYEETYSKQFDLKTYLEDIEADTPATKYFDSSLAKKNSVTLSIPSKGSVFYDDVVKTFLITLYDTPTTEANYGERMARVEKIIDKCIAINDAYSEYFNDNASTYSLLLMPESEVLDYNKAYLKTPYFLSYDLYLKNDDKLNKDIIEQINTKKKIFKNIKYRITERTYKIDTTWDTYTSFLENYIFEDTSDMFLY